MDKGIILEMLTYIEQMETAIEDEFGMGELFENLPSYNEDHGNGGEKPELYFKLKKLLED